MESEKGRVYIASMNLRGSWATCPDNVIKINVTSAQSKSSKNRLVYSPMTPIQNGYKGFYNFEHYWQSGKVFEGLNHERSIKWWQEQKQPRRRLPQSKKHRCLYATYENCDDQDQIDKELDYVTSRKKVYVPEYYKLVINNELTQQIIKQIEKGKNVVVYDFDGPRDQNGGVLCKELTLDLLKEKINDKKFPFGHGYIVAAMFSGIHYNQYV